MRHGSFQILMAYILVNNVILPVQYTPGGSISDLKKKKGHWAKVLILRLPPSSLIAAELLTFPPQAFTNCAGGSNTTSCRARWSLNYSGTTLCVWWCMPGSPLSLVVGGGFIVLWFLGKPHTQTCIGYHVIIGSVHPLHQCGVSGWDIVVCNSPLVYSFVSVTPAPEDKPEHLSSPPAMPVAVHLRSLVSYITLKWALCLNPWGARAARQPFRQHLKIRSKRLEI